MVLTGIVEPLLDYVFCLRVERKEQFGFDDGRSGSVFLLGGESKKAGAAAAPAGYKTSTSRCRTN